MHETRTDRTQSDMTAEILQGAQELWDRANQPATRSLPMDHLTPKELKCSSSLIQVYICAATAKSYFNLDVEWHLQLEQRRIDGEFDEDLAMDIDEDGDEGAEWDTGTHGHGHDAALTRRFRMRDDNMHRVFLPLTCAIELCDQILPERLAYIVAGYIADIIPRYATGSFRNSVFPAPTVT